MMIKRRRIVRIILITLLSKVSTNSKHPFALIIITGTYKGKEYLQLSNVRRNVRSPVLKQE